MRALILLIVPVLLAIGTPASAHHKPGHHIPPGQMKKIYQPEVAVPVEVEYVCLVTTANPGDPYARVPRTEWLPKADAQWFADAGNSFIIYHPSVNDEFGCLNF